MEQALKLLKAQQPAVLKDPFPQGQNSASASNVAGGTQNAPDRNYINMVRSLNLLQIRNKNYEKETPEKGKAVGETSNPLTVNTQKVFTTSSTPLHGSFVLLPTIFPLKTLKIPQKSLQKA